MGTQVGCLQNDGKDSSAWYLLHNRKYLKYPKTLKFSLKIFKVVNGIVS